MSSEWIKCSDRLPEKLPFFNYSDDVLFIDEQKVMYVGSYRSVKNQFRENNNSCGCCWDAPTVTHWMPLPPLPEK